MAASTNIFTDKNTNNWFKACIALNFTKEGLTNFIETELQKVKAAVGINCGTCSIENLMTCPTPGLCNKRKRTICMFHQTKVPKHCKICDPVKQRIMSFHRFYNPSWRNTKAERWATDPWEIGKCYLPLMDTKVRQIGRDVRHTADCKVTDADLQYYFQTLTTLQADPKCLMYDPSAISARTKLSQNDRMSLYELGELLKDASQTLKQAKEAGELYSKVAETTLQEALQSIEATIQAGKQHIETVINDSKQQLSFLTQESVKEIKEETRVGIERIQQVETDQVKKDYEREADEMLRGLTAHYDNKLSYVTTSPLRHCVQEQLRDIYMPPNMLLMANEKQSFKKTGIQITNYDRMFSKVGQENGKTFIQGEAGTGKSTFLAKLVMDWSRIQLAEQFKTRIEDTITRTKYSTFFQDSWTLQRYRFVFLITLRNSVTEISIYNMIKEQIIDSIYASEEDRQKAYTLLNEIMKCERCLILLDGLDEWTGPGGRHSLPILVTSHRQCVLLITTRPWKVAEGKINHSEINTLLQLEGVNDPFELSRILLSFLIDRKELNGKHSEFRRCVSEQKLDDLLSSPLMLSVIVCLYAGGNTLKGSKCEIYCILLESLLKKINSKTSEFQHPPFPCFKETEYIQPNIELVNRLAEAAFHLLFSNTRENSLVFGVRELKQYKLDEEMDIALKSGILSATQTASALRPLSSFSFIHKSLQEFLAAYHIARKTIAFEGIIFEYLQRSDSSYLDISQVLIFLCGLDISAANTISEMMNKCDQLHYKDYMFNPSPFQHCVLSGYREAVANAQKCINLKLSHLTIDDDTIHPDLHSLWVMNASNVESLRVTVFSRDPVSDGTSSTECVKSASSMDFQLASCHKLKVLKLYGYGICLKDVLSAATSVFPVRFLLNNADLTSPVMPSIEHIELGDITCSATLLRSLFNILKTVKNDVKCVFEDCEITSVVNGIIHNSYIGERTEIITHLNACIAKSIMISIDHDSDALWEAWRGLNIRSLSIRGCLDSSTMKRVLSLVNLLASLKKETTLSFKLNNGSLQGTFHGFHINSLSCKLDNVSRGLESSLMNLLSSLEKLETLSLELSNYSAILLEALRGLHIKSLGLRGCLYIRTWDENTSLSQLLSSLAQLETLSLELSYDSPFLWEALRGLHMKSLGLSGCLFGRTWDEKSVRLLSQLLSSLAQLETLSLELRYGRHFLWEALRGLHIKSLGLSGCIYIWTWDEKTSFSQLLSSFAQLETLSLQLSDAEFWGEIILFDALHDLHIRSLSVTLDEFPDESCFILHSFSQCLLSLKHLETLSLKVDPVMRELWEFHIRKHHETIKLLSM